ncbi:hypothetical protein BDY19DRAFT_998576 [Irpex rosettiformis]|uniref:Uncharacterized protein n=1 Tax=Irpex rosettiformis TaxID=378272 RepID=A0ACB8TN36_9APHY|nr:hypothetical protein BDY19DRAFT_998576 [Irpex rosettiformis]
MVRPQTRPSRHLTVVHTRTLGSLRGHGELDSGGSVPTYVFTWHYTSTIPPTPPPPSPRSSNTKSKPKRPLIVYGVISDIYHCIIVRVSNKKGAYIVSRTVTLDFIPTLYAKNTSTPGITALVRFGNINVPDDTWFFYTGLRRM